MILRGIVLAVLMMWLSGAAQAAGSAPAYKPGELIVRYRAAAAARFSAQSAFLPAGISLRAVRPLIPAGSPAGMRAQTAARNDAMEPFQRTWLISYDGGADPADIAASLAADPSVEYAHPNYMYRAFEVIPNDTDFGSQWALRNTGQAGGTAGADISATEAWTISTGDGSAVIAIVDTGVDYTHPDLAANIWSNTDEIPGNGIDDDANGYIDDVRGWDTVNNDNDPQDDVDHGTHCSGIAAARGNNALGVAGVVWNARIMPVKVLGPSSGDDITVTEGILYAARNGARVISLSLGAPTDSPTLKNAVTTAVDTYGVVVVAAAGNDNNELMNYPAAYDKAIAVAATDSADKKASFSTFGTWVDISAPGNSIMSTLPGGLYGNMSGTSMATPMVAGLLGLMLSVNPTMTGPAAAARLFSSCDSISATNPAYAGKLGAGRINASRALDAAPKPPSRVVKCYPVPCRMNTDGYLRIGPYASAAPGVRTRIYSITGELVRELTDGDVVSTSSGYFHRWDGLDSRGEKAASGLYFLMINEAGTQIRDRAVIFW